jgi:hypothetical protein
VRRILGAALEVGVAALAQHVGIQRCQASAQYS